MATVNRNTMQAAFRTVNGPRIGYAETSGPAEQTILLTSPRPESPYAFAPIWTSLAQEARLFAVDLRGFGGSQRRNDRLSAHATDEFRVRLIDECDRRWQQAVSASLSSSASWSGAGAPTRRARLQQATLTIRAHIPLEVPRDIIQPFPTFSEIYLAAESASRRDRSRVPGGRARAQARGGLFRLTSAAHRERGRKTAWIS